MNKNCQFKKIIYCVFLISTLIAIVAGAEVSITLFKMFYSYKAYHAAMQVLETTMYWCWFLIGIFLFVRREIAIIPLILGTPNTFIFSYNVLINNGWNTNVVWQFNTIAAIAAVIMLISGYLYYFRLIFQDRSKIKTWFDERFQR